LAGIDCEDSDTEIEELHIFPNPSIDELYVEFTADKNTLGTISIFNINNQLILQEEISLLKDKNTLDFSYLQLPAGMYFFRIQSKNSDLYSRFIIER
jgi:hypothetical protein